MIHTSQYLCASWRHAGLDKYTKNEPTVVLHYFEASVVDIFDDLIVNLHFDVNFDANFDVNSVEVAVFGS